MGLSSRYGHCRCRRGQSGRGSGRSRGIVRPRLVLVSGVPGLRRWTARSGSSSASSVVLTGFQPSPVQVPGASLSSQDRNLTSGESRDKVTAGNMSNCRFGRIVTMTLVQTAWWGWCLAMVSGPEGVVAQLGGPAVMIRGGSRRVWCHIDRITPPDSALVAHRSSASGSFGINRGEVLPPAASDLEHGSEG